MSHYSHLCCGLRREIYPSIREGDYSLDDQTVADAVFRVPLVWLCLFRPEDLIEDDVTSCTEGGESVTERVRAPVVERRLIRQRLKEAVPRIEAVFPGCGSLRQHAAKLREAIDSVDKAYPFVTIEYQDVAVVAGYERWDTLIQRVLEFLSGQDIPDARERLLDVADLEEIRRFVPVRRYLEDDDISEDDWILLDALLGGESPRPAPWLPQRVPQEALPLPELLLAVNAGEAERVAELLQAGADPNAVDPNSQETPLEAAFARCCWKAELPEPNSRIVELLLAAGTRVTDASLAHAAKFVPMALFEFMFAAHANPNACDPLGTPAVHLACESSQNAAAKVRLLLDAGADVNRRTPTHYSALWSAFSVRNLDVAKLLFERGLDSDAADEVLVVANYQSRRRRNHLDEWFQLLRSRRTRLVDLPRPISCRSPGLLTRTSGIDLRFYLPKLRRPDSSGSGDPDYVRC